jgi:hypothetical protein
MMACPSGMEHERSFHDAWSSCYLAHRGTGPKLLGELSWHIERNSE